MSYLAPTTSTAAWLVAGAMRDGINLWSTGDRITWHGPKDARERWEAPLHLWKTPLQVYLQGEVFPGLDSGTLWVI